MKKVLIVDDEERIRRIYRNLLVNESFVVIEASNVNDANEILVNEEIALLLLDIRMPELSGAVLVKNLQLFHKKIKVIIASVYSIDDQMRMIPYANGYYDKSQGTGVLLEQIKSVLKNEQE